jgi:tRNA pseudouridine55 synthase
MRILTKHNLHELAQWSAEAAESGAIVLIDKQQGWTSFDIVAKLRRLTGIKKIGHAGTLDPLATGLLIVCVGRPATRKIDEFQGKDKRYHAELKLGYITASYDAETPEQFYASVPDDFPEANLRNIIPEFSGNIEQIPPVYSALKKDGIPLYKLARRGEEPEVKPRSVIIHNLNIISCQIPIITLDILCSKGTYIRSLAHDMGRRLETGAYLSGLRRISIGDFHVNDALDIHDIRKAYLQLAAVQV